MQPPPPPYGQPPQDTPGGYGGTPPGGYGGAPPGGYGAPGGAPGGSDPERESKLKTAKMMSLGGGGGCLIAVLCLFVGFVLIAFGTQRATREAMPFGILLVGLATLPGLLGAVLLVLGLMSKKNAG